MTEKVDKIKPANAALRYQISQSDLPLHCPMDGQSQWDSHPRVFLPIEDQGEILCPYCGALYQFKDGEQ